MNLVINRLSFTLLCLLTLLAPTSPSIVLNVTDKVFQPKEFLLVDEVIEKSNPLGQFRHPFDNINYEISSRVLEYTPSTISQKNNALMYQHDPSNFQLSSSCRIQPSQVMLSTMTQTKRAESPIKAYHYNNDRVFVLSGDTLSLYALPTDQPSVDTQLKSLGELRELNLTFGLSETGSRFVSLGRKTYICDERSLYLVSVSEEGPSVKMGLSKVKGYIPLSNFGELIRLVPRGQQSFFLLSNEAVTEYVFDSPLNCQGKQIVNQTNENKHNFVDMAHIRHYIVLLQEVQGLFLHNTHTQGNLQKYPLDFEGIFIKMQSLGTTIEVIGEYYGKRYVAELFLHTTNNSQNQIVLNRFYNQISGIRDIDFFDNKAIFIGEDEIMVIAHSTNRNLLLDKTRKQNRQLYLAYGINQFDIIKSVSSHRRGYVIGITQYNLMLIQLDQQAPSLVCDLDSSTSIKRLVVEFNTTSCGTSNEREASMGSESFCRVLESVNLEVTAPMHSKANSLLLVGTILACIVGVIVLCGLACKFKAIKFRLFGNLIQQIQERRRAAATTETI